METQKKSFILTIEPQFPLKRNFFFGLEGLVGLNVNGVEVFPKKDGRFTDEPIGYLIRWLAENYNKYTGDNIPKETYPARFNCSKLKQDILGPLFGFIFSGIKGIFPEISFREKRRNTRICIRSSSYWIKKTIAKVFKRTKLSKTFGEDCITILC